MEVDQSMITYRPVEFHKLPYLPKVAPEAELSEADNNLNLAGVGFQNLSNFIANHTMVSDGAKRKKTVTFSDENDVIFFKPFKEIYTNLENSKKKLEKAKNDYELVQTHVQSADLVNQQNAQIYQGLKEQFYSKEQELITLNSALEVAEEEKRSLKEEFTQLQNHATSLFESNQKLNGEIQTKINEVNEKNQLIQRKEQEFNTLQNTTIDSVMANDTLTEASKTLAKYSLELTNALNEVSALNEQLTVMSAEKAKIEEEVSQYEGKIQENTKENQRIGGELVLTRKQVESLAKEKQTISETYSQQLQIVRNNAEKKVDEWDAFYEGEKASWNTQMMQLKNEYVNQLNQKDTEQNQKEQEIVLYTNNLEELKNKLALVKNELNEVKTEFQGEKMGFETKVYELQTKNQEVQATLDLVLSQKEEISTEIVMLREGRDQSEIEAFEIESRKKKMEEDVERIAKEKEQSAAIFDLTLKSRENDLAILTKNFEKTRRELDELQTTKDALELEKNLELSILEKKANDEKAAKESIKKTLEIIEKEKQGIESKQLTLIKLQSEKEKEASEKEKELKKQLQENKKKEINLEQEVKKLKEVVAKAPDQSLVVLQGLVSEKATLIQAKEKLIEDQERELKKLRQQNNLNSVFAQESSALVISKKLTQTDANLEENFKKTAASLKQAENTIGSITKERDRLQNDIADIQLYMVNGVDFVTVPKFDVKDRENKTVLRFGKNIQDWLKACVESDKILHQIGFYKGTNNLKPGQNSDFSNPDKLVIMSQETLQNFVNMTTNGTSGGSVSVKLKPVIPIKGKGPLDLSIHYESWYHPMKFSEMVNQQDISANPDTSNRRGLYDIEVFFKTGMKGLATMNQLHFIAKKVPVVTDLSEENIERDAYVINFMYGAEKAEKEYLGIGTLTPDCIHRGGILSITVAETDGGKTVDTYESGYLVGDKKGNYEANAEYNTKIVYRLGNKVQFYLRDLGHGTYILETMFIYK